MANCGHAHGGNTGSADKWTKAGSLVGFTTSFSVGLSFFGFILLRFNDTQDNTAKHLGLSALVVALSLWTSLSAASVHRKMDTLHQTSNSSGDTEALLTTEASSKTCHAWGLSRLQLPVFIGDGSDHVAGATMTLALSATSWIHSIFKYKIEDSISATIALYSSCFVMSLIGSASAIRTCLPYARQLGKH